MPTLARSCTVRTVCLTVRLQAKKDTLDVLLDARPPLVMWWSSDSPLCHRDRLTNKKPNLFSCICCFSRLYFAGLRYCFFLMLPAMRFVFQSISVQLFAQQFSLEKADKLGGN